MWDIIFKDFFFKFWSCVSGACLQRPVEGTGYPKAGSCDVPNVGAGHPNLGPLQDQYALWASGPSLQPRFNVA